ncbi:MAG: DUF1178 family protein [Alphaproteobacteria bacterium]|nr:DUF1178 family protein [Alphaproteobacteria bacterium]
MILYDLICGKGHGFEGWFRDGKTYDQQARGGKVACPICGNRKVKKAIMAPRLSRGAAAPAERAPTAAPAQAAAPAESQAVMVSDEAKAKAAELLNAMRELRSHVEANSDYVGDRFAETARQIHYGETDKRNIYGEASEDDARELHEEGISFQRIPWVPRGN